MVSLSVCCWGCVRLKERGGPISLFTTSFIASIPSAYPFDGDSLLFTTSSLRYYYSGYPVVAAPSVGRKNVAGWTIKDNEKPLFSSLTGTQQTMYYYSHSIGWWSVVDPRIVAFRWNCLLLSPYHLTTSRNVDGNQEKRQRFPSSSRESVSHLSMRNDAYVLFSNRIIRDVFAAHPCA